MIIIYSTPFELTAKEEGTHKWRVIKMLATKDLELCKSSMERDIAQNIPVRFLEDVILTISVNKKTMKKEIDYSQTKSKSAIKLLKLYWSGDIKTFAKEWVRRF